MEKILSEAIRIARLAGERIRELREKNEFSEQLKYGYELVTTADIISNGLIKSELSAAFPDHNFISEEEEEKDSSIQEPAWIVDPIDGTVGYANHHYQVAVSIAFAVGNRVRTGVVYNPFLEELFYAAEGTGAFLNDRPIHVKDVSDMKQCVIGTGFPHKKENVHEIVKRLENILPYVRDIRRMGSGALDICWVACGRLQGYYESGLHSWDIAAARLIAEEAGAKIGRYGKKNAAIPDCIDGDDIMVSSPGIFDELLRRLTNG